MPPKNGQESSEFAAILAEMKAIKKGLSAKLDSVASKVDAVAEDVKDLRRICRDLFDAVVEQEVRMTKVEGRVEALEAEVVLLKRGGSNGASPPSAA